MTEFDNPHGSASRRRFLGLGLAGAATLFAPPAFAALPAAARTLSLHHAHTGESLRIAYRVDGALVPDALASLDRLLRDFRSGEQVAIDPNLFDLLHGLRQRLRTDRPFHIISGYRSPRTNEMLRRTGGGGVSSRSLHLVGMAIDIRIPGRSTADIYRAARDLQGGGVGHYPKSGFVHIDTGRVRFW